MGHTDKSWRNGSGVASLPLDRSQGTFSFCDIEQLTESPGVQNVHCSIYCWSREHSFPPVNQQDPVSGQRARRYLLLFTWSENFLQFFHTHNWPNKKSKRLLHLCKLIAPFLNQLVWYCLREEKSWLREAWILFFISFLPLVMESCDAALKPCKAESCFILSKHWQGSAKAGGHSGAMGAAKYHEESMTCSWHSLFKKWPFAFAPILSGCQPLAI